MSIGVDWLVSAYVSQSALVYRRNLWQHDDKKLSTIGWNQVLTSHTH